MAVELDRRQGAVWYPRLTGSERVGLIRCAAGGQAGALSSELQR